MDSKKQLTLYYFATAAFLVLAIIRFLDANIMFGIYWLCLAAVFLFLGLSFKKKIKNSQSDEKKDEHKN